MGGLRGLLGTIPCGPGFAFHAVDLLEFRLLGQVEVSDGRLAPMFLDLLQVRTDSGLADAHAFGNLALGQALEV